MVNVTIYGIHGSYGIDNYRFIMIYHDISICFLCVVCLYHLCAYVFLGGVLKVFFFERGCPKMRNSGLKDG